MENVLPVKNEHQGYSSWSDYKFKRTLKCSRFLQTTFLIIFPFNSEAKGCRQGYMGHLIRMVNQIAGNTRALALGTGTVTRTGDDVTMIEDNTLQSELDDATFQRWSEFLLGPLADMNKKNDTNLVRVHVHVDGWIDGWMDGWVGGWMDGWVRGWMDGRTDGWTDGWMDGRTDGWMHGWKDRVTDRQTDRWIKMFYY